MPEPNRKPEKKQVGKFEVQMQIPLLSDAGCRAAHELAGFQFGFDTPDGLQHFPPNDVPTDVLLREAERISATGDPIIRANELRNLLTGFVEFAQRAREIAVWGIEADEFLKGLPAKFKALEGTHVDRFRPVGKDSPDVR